MPIHTKLLTNAQLSLVLIKDYTTLYYTLSFSVMIVGAQAAGNAAAAVASGQPETAIEHTDYRNKLTEIRTIYHQEVSSYHPLRRQVYGS